MSGQGERGSRAARSALVRALLAALCVATVLCALTTSVSAEVASAQAAREDIQHAWTFYWAGLLDGGDVLSFDRGLEFAADAKQELERLPATDAEVVTLQKRRAEVQAMLVDQRRVAAETLRGWFPLTALLKKSLLLNSAALGNFELIDDPGDVAVSKLVEDLRDDVLSKWGAMPQTDVTVVSMLEDRALEDKVLFLLSTTPRVNLRPVADIAQVMPPDVVERLLRGDTAEAGEQVRKHYGADRFIVVTIKGLDEVENVHVLELGAHVFSGKEPTAFSILGVTHDRRGQLPALILVIFACFMVGLGLTWWLTRSRLSPGEVFSMSALAFFGGIAIPNALLGLIGNFEPPGEELVILSFWWAVIACMSIMLGTPIAFTSLVKRFGGTIPALRRMNEFGPQVACATGAGVASFLARAPIVYDPQLGWLTALLMMGCCIGAARMVSQLRARMTIEPRYMLSAIAGLVLAGPAFFSDSVGALAICALVVIVASARAEAARRAMEEEVGLASTEDAPEELDDDALSQLVRHARRPSFHVFSPFKRAQELLAGASEEGVRWLFLRGQRGSGKTSTSEAIIAAAPKHAVILRGACSPPSSQDAQESADAKPFEVFARAFHGVGLLGFEEPEEDIFSSIEGRVISAIPIVSMLIPNGEEEGSAVSDRGELYARMVRELIKQTRRGSRRVYLVLDDIQWMDAASQELLLHMMSVFGADSEHRISFMMCGRGLPEQLENTPLSERLLGGNEVCVELDDADRLKLLQDNIGLQRDSAVLLDEAVTDREGKSNLAWLFTLVEAVARSGQIAQEADGSFRVTVADGQQLPIPDSFKKIIGQSHDGLTRQNQELLRVAACLGYSFSLEVLARVVEKSRLEVITRLEEIGESTGIVEDDLSSDDVFKFVSTQRYLALRGHLGIHDAHPRERISQLLRDLQLRIARVLEDLMEEHRADVSDVAAHYWAAGQRDLPRALKYCRQAARAARDVFAFDGAEFQLRRALVCAEILAQSSLAEEVRRDAARQHAELEVELRILPFDEAHILGRVDLSAEQAEQAIELFRRDVSDGRVDVPLELLFVMTRACYDARRFEEALEIARALVDLGDTQGQRDKKARRLSEEDLQIRDLAYVEGLHFIGISLDPRTQAAQRLDWLTRARAAAEALDTSDERRRALQARVFNSLGEQLAQQATYDFDAARTWFHRSISIKKELKPKDKPGLARAHGGLGRLYLFAARRDEAQRRALLKKARQHFEEDIELCQDYGDVGGESQMHSHLGECALMLERYADAATSYARSLELSHSPISMGFAQIGLMKAYQGLQDREAAVACARAICTLAIENDLPPFLGPMLLEALAQPILGGESIPALQDARRVLGAAQDEGEEE